VLGGAGKERRRGDAIASSRRSDTASVVENEADV
jgi:hypothetical protein